MTGTYADCWEGQQVEFKPTPSPRYLVEAPKSPRFYGLEVPSTVALRVSGPDAAMVGAVGAAVAASKVDWRTPGSIASELGITGEMARSALVSLEGSGKVRRPVDARPGEEDFYRATDRSRTFGERVRLVRDLLTRG